MDAGRQWYYMYIRFINRLYELLQKVYFDRELDMSTVELVIHYNDGHKLLPGFLLKNQKII